jgi:hypothetical protein
MEVKGELIFKTLSGINKILFHRNIDRKLLYEIKGSLEEIFLNNMNIDIIGEKIKIPDISNNKNDLELQGVKNGK